MMVRQEPPTFDGASIRRLRPPEVEGATGEWTSRWLLRLDIPIPAGAAQLDILSAQLTAHTDARVSVRSINDREVRLEMQSEVHPLDPEAYPLTDHVLMALDSALGGIDEINGSPRDWWRTFRSGAEG